MRKTWPAAAVLAAALVAVQHFGLERTAERREENRSTNLAALKATRVLPQYIASLFMGSFRAIVVNVLWVEQRRLREEEHRFFETAQIIDMIASLQPRNPEVWVHEAWSVAYNIATHVRDPEERWKWVRYGLDKLEEATRQMATDPYLKFEVGRVLMHKATVQEGILDMEYIRRFEREQTEDKAFQRAMFRGAERAEPGSTFEASIVWLEGALEDLRRMKEEKRWKHIRATGDEARNERDYHTTQVGGNIHPSTVDGFIRLAKYFQGWRCWRDGRDAEAARWFRASAAHARMMLERYGRYSPALSTGLSGIFDTYAHLGDALAEAALLPRATQEDRLRLLDHLAVILDHAGVTDYGHAAGLATVIKREFQGDPHEFNDTPARAMGLQPGEPLEATLRPRGDADCYAAEVPAPPGPRAVNDTSIPPVRVVFEIQKRGDVDLRVTLLEPYMDRYNELESIEVREGTPRAITTIRRHHGAVILRVEPLDARAAASAKRPEYAVRLAR